MDYQMGLEKLKTLGPPGFDVLAMNGPWLEFTKVPESGRTAPEFSSHLEKEGVVLDTALTEALGERIGGGKLYVHQERAIEAVLAGKSVILPHPTGTGKTECFVVPILNYLLGQIYQVEEKTFGLGSIMIFPTKALENDQRDRLKWFLYRLERKHGNRIPRIGVYDGDTPHRTDFERFGANSKRDKLRAYSETCPKCGKDSLVYDIGHRDHLLWCDNSRRDSKGEPIGCGYPRPKYPSGIPWIRTYREDMCESEHFPNLLITNPEALDYQLLQNPEEGLFKTRMSRVIVVIDEAHAYDAESCLSFRVLMSRLEQKIRDVNGRDVQFQYVISSATLDDPAAFARRLIPWVNAKTIDFVQKPDPFPAGPVEINHLDGPIAAIDPTSPEWIFNSFDKPFDNTPEHQTLVRLKIVKEVDGLLRPGSTQIHQAWTEWNLNRSSGEPSALIHSHIRSTLLGLDQARELFKKAQAEPSTLQQLAKWWSSEWAGFNEEQATETIAELVFLGRKVQLWNERWHLFVRAPTGFAGCTGQTFHLYPTSSEEQLIESCPRCPNETPILEVMTCQACGDIYFVVYMCPTCDPISLWPSPETDCGHGPASQAAILERDACVGVSNLSTLGGQARQINRKKKNKCSRCDETLVELKRRSDLVIEMSVSLAGWHADEEHRKFLLFSDGRASSERISREFNNLEKLLWAERLVMNAMLPGPEHGAHDARTLSEVRTSINWDLKEPYLRGLRPVLSKNEWEALDQSLWLCVARALGRSSYGKSRLFEHGLLGYVFPEEVVERSHQLAIEEVLPRVADLIRLHESHEAGISQSALIEWFVGTTKGPRKVHPTARAHLMGLAGVGNRNILNALAVLKNAGWIAEELDTSKPTPETYYWFREDEPTEEDPFAVPHDPRRIRIPPEVWWCETCGFVRWYRLVVCENCGSPMKEIGHSELLSCDYFAKILLRKPVPIVSAVHRAGLDPFERRALEARFQADKNLVHLLCATPTLELGIDIGFLDFVILAKVPSTRSSYIQRVGRAGRRKDEGAICVTYAYPTPIDGHYFHHPEGLVSMKSSRVPVQRLSPAQLGSFIWAGVFDCYAKRRSALARTTFDGAVTARAFLEDRAPLKVAELISQLSSDWDSAYAPYARAILSRSVIDGVDKARASDLEDALSHAKATLANLQEFGEEVLRTPAFESQRDEIEAIHTAVSQAITTLHVKKGKTNEDFEKLARLENEDDNIKEYKRSHMMSSPIINYLHDVGTLPTPRGIGGSVFTYDLEGMDRVLDDRGFALSIMDRFPGALISRQGAIYQVKRVVHDPLPSRRPTISLCPVCGTWMQDGAVNCALHPTKALDNLTLLQPVVGFATLTRLRNRETHGLLESRLRFGGAPLKFDAFQIGSLDVRVSGVVDLEVASFCRNYSVIEDGRAIERGAQLLKCSNCGSYPEDDSPCCDSPLPQPIVQGCTYSTRAINIKVDQAVLSTRIAEAATNGVSVSGEGPQEVSQSLAFGLLNALAIVLDVEPTVLDVWRAPDDSIWIYEPTDGGLGILDDLRADPHLLADVFKEIVELVHTQPQVHDCQRYCDQCLLVPRRVLDIIRYLNRPLLEAVLS